MTFEELSDWPSNFLRALVAIGVFATSKTVRRRRVLGNPIAFVKPTVFEGGDRPGSRGIEVGWKLLGF